MAGDVHKKPLGVLLKDKGLITEDHIQFALQEQKITKEKVGEVLERLAFVTQYEVTITLAEQDGLPYIDLDEVVPNEELLRRFSKTLCLNNAFIPLRTVGNNIQVANAGTAPPNLAQIINRQTGLVPKFFLAETDKILNSIHKYYYFMENPVETLIQNEVKLLMQDSEMARGMDNLLKHILHYAIKMRATDIHIRPMDRLINIAFRIDGVITSVLSVPSPLKRIISAIKMKSEMDIAEQRLPQDGRFSATILNHEYDFRVSTIVSPHGENVAMRILPKDSSVMGLSQLGFFEGDVRTVDKMFNEPYGIILLTGPTGSGKSTTLYGGIRGLNLLQKNVLTVENPIEFNVPLLRQTQVNEKAGYTFSNAIRYFLRHDPDVILIGEIRDSETAATAISASTTGHLVLSTLHTNSAIGAIPRLKDLGIRPFLIADSLLGVVSQRLVRRICSNCKEAYVPSKQEKAYLNDPDLIEVFKGKGCDICNGRGYFGRTLVYEILTIDSRIAGLIDQEAKFEEIYRKAVEIGFVDIFQVAVNKIRIGITSIDEITRVLGSLKQTSSAAALSDDSSGQPTESEAPMDEAMLDEQLFGELNEP